MFLSFLINHHTLDYKQHTNFMDTTQITVISEMMQQSVNKLFELLLLCLFSL